MTGGEYVPEAGDVVWLQFNPQSGHEQAGHRPALVLSPSNYNRKSGLMLCCPMTSRVKGYPFEVAVGDASVALADQIKSLDWRARGARLKERVPEEVLAKTRAKLGALIG